jgi:hypothetical protein
MKEIIFGIICIIGVLIVGHFATRLNRRTFPQRPKSTLSSAIIPFAAILAGFVFGVLVIPLSLIPENQYVKVVFSIVVTIAFGTIELMVLRKLPGKWLNKFLLDGDAFPFVSLGFACSILLKFLF